MTPFFICHSPGAGLPQGMVCGIYGTGKPRFFAELYKLRPFLFSSDMHLGGPNVLFYYRSAITGQLDYHVLVVKDNIDEAGPERLEKTLRKAVEWYATVLSDAIGEVKGKAHELAFAGAYNPALPGVRILQLSHKGWYLLCHDTAVDCFEHIEELLDYLVEFKGFPEEAVTEGMVNYEA